MNICRIYKGDEVIEFHTLTAVTQEEAGWFVFTCPELGVASQGKTRKEAHRMLADAVEVWLETANTKEIKRRLKLGGRVEPLQLAHA
jgi:predicted RNase H-like HicB family nuclease